MKIIAGERKGHSLLTPKGRETRPTLARVRESLFSIIAGDLPGCVFCDMFAGAGVIGLEALSRGAGRAILIENSREAYQCLQGNVERLHYSAQATTLMTDVLKWPIPTDEAAPDIIFADPPYKSEVIQKLIHRLETVKLKPDTLVILQTSSRQDVSVATMKHLRTAKYGNTALHFFLTQEPENA